MQTGDTLPFRSIRSLYALALAEGEGIGTAYEYFAKRLVLRRWLARHERPSRVLIAGLPEKYGSSLDFLLIATELGASEVVVADDRQSALEKGRNSLAAAQSRGQILGAKPRYLLLSDLNEAKDLPRCFDLCLSSEVLQRLPADTARQFVNQIKSSASFFAIFGPNAANSGHNDISGLAGLHLSDLQQMMQRTGIAAQVGYVDMPPFPPGITRSAEQRQQASSGGLEAALMWGLNYYARLEKGFPLFWRRRHSHIVYALSAA